LLLVKSFQGLGNPVWNPPISRYEAHFLSFPFTLLLACYFVWFFVHLWAFSLRRLQHLHPFSHLSGLQFWPLITVRSTRSCGFKKKVTSLHAHLICGSTSLPLPKKLSPAVQTQFRRTLCSERSMACGSESSRSSSPPLLDSFRIQYISDRRRTSICA
jgi:hypothetical protein